MEWPKSDNSKRVFVGFEKSLMSITCEFGWPWKHFLQALPQLLYSHHDQYEAGHWKSKCVAVVASGSSIFKLNCAFIEGIDSVFRLANFYFQQRGVARDLHKILRFRNQVLVCLVFLKVCIRLLSAGKIGSARLATKTSTDWPTTCTFE